MHLIIDFAWTTLNACACSVFVHDLAEIDVQTATEWMLARSRHLTAPTTIYFGTDLERTHQAKFDIAEQLGCYCVGLGTTCRKRYCTTPSSYWRLGNEVKSQRASLHVHFIGDESDGVTKEMHRRFRLAKLRVPKTPAMQASLFVAFVQGIGRCCLLCPACHGAYHAACIAERKTH